MAGDRRRAGVAREAAAAAQRLARRGESFTALRVASQPDLRSAPGASELVLVAGSGVTITTNATTGAATISASSSGGVEEFLVRARVSLRI